MFGHRPQAPAVSVSAHVPPVQVTAVVASGPPPDAGAVASPGEGTEADASTMEDADASVRPKTSGFGGPAVPPHAAANGIGARRQAAVRMDGR